jgi:hypothetical protein
MIDKKFKFNLGGSINTIGSGGGGGGGTINGTIQNTQVAYGTATDTIGGENDFVYDTVNNLLTVEKTKTQVIVEIRNETGATINAGAVVYVAGSHSSGRPLVALADASDSAKMPSAFVVANQLATGNNGYGILTGLLNGLNGSAGNTVFDQTLTTADIGKTVYVSPINAGRLTIDKPTGLTELIQNVGRITDFSGSNAKIAVNNIGRSNDVPNSIDAGQLTVNSSYTFPSSDGTSGQTLVTNGSGTLSFQTPTADQVIVSAVTDESITDGDLVRYLQNGEGGTLGRIVLANAGETQSRDIFLTLTTGVSGDAVSLLLNGSVNMNFGSSVASTEIGQIVYLSTTDGKATLTPPSTSGDYVIQLGTVIDASGTNRATVIFRPQFIMEIG